jgi:hypothetical protein
MRASLRSPSATARCPSPSKHTPNVALSVPRGLPPRVEAIVFGQLLRGGKTINPVISTARLLRGPARLGLGLFAAIADNARPLLRPTRVADRKA